MKINVDINETIHTKYSTMAITVRNKMFEIDYDSLDNEIAKFIGWFTQEGQEGTWFCKDGNAIYVAYSAHNNYPHKNLPFSRDWNYLQTVIEDIENTCHPNYDGSGEYFTVNIYGGVCEISISEYGEVQQSVEGYQYFYVESKLQSTYLAVGNFCKWYNKIRS